MGKFSTPNQGGDKWLVFGAVSLAFFFLNLSTFTSLGVVLFTMAGELHWSLTAAGFCFTLLGLACGLSSPLPAWSMKQVGGRITLCIGAVLLICGFGVAAISDSLFSFYMAMVLVGLGYSFAGNVPGVYLIAGWFGRGSSRIIGFYLMLGALGAALGPPIVEAAVSHGGWRGNWWAMAVAAACIGIVCFAFVRDAKNQPTTGSLVDNPQYDPDTVASEWPPRRALRTSQFLLVAASMAMTMACVTTYSSVAVTHLVKLGATPSIAALVLSVMAMTATVLKAVSGRLCENVRSAYVLAGGLALQAAGSAVLAFADTNLLRYLGAVLFGTGWGLGYVAGTVVLLDYFGRNTGSKILSIVWFLTTVAAAGPLAAGMIADSVGTFAPIFLIYAGMLLVLSVPILLMREPLIRTAPSAAKKPTPGLVRNVTAL